MNNGFNIVDEGILDMDDLDQNVEKSAAWNWLRQIFDKTGRVNCSWEEWCGIQADISKHLDSLSQITIRKTHNISKKSGAVLESDADSLIIIRFNFPEYPVICRYLFSHGTKKTITEVCRIGKFKGSSKNTYFEIPVDVADDILQHLGIKFNECEGAAPANTIGMGNPSMPTDTAPGSGDLPAAKAKKRKKFKELTEGILDDNAGADFDLMDILFIFKKKLKKYAAMKLRRINPLGYTGDAVDSNFKEVLKSLYNKTLKKYIKKSTPDEFKPGILCQVHIKDIYIEPFIIINWHENPNKWHQLYIRKRYPTENFLCQEQILTGRAPADTYDEEAAYLPVIFATELAQFFKYRLTSFISYD